MASEIPGFLITFREALEAALIVTILLAYLRKIGRGNLGRYVWFGTALALILSMVIGSAVFIVYGELSGVATAVFEGFASLIAAGILTYMIFWMASNSRKIKGELERRVDLSLTRGQRSEERRVGKECRL